jgi:hypothetical protein
MCLELIPIRIGRIRIDMSWMMIPIRIRENDPDPQHCSVASFNKLQVFYWNQSLECYHSPPNTSVIGFLYTREEP